MEQLCILQTQIFHESNNSPKIQLASKAPSAVAGSAYRKMAAQLAWQ